jgi:hypothetical protein
VIWIVAILAAFTLGLMVESHWCGHRHQASRWEAVARREHDRQLEALASAKRWIGAARHWHREFEREKRTSDGHAEMLRALGRAVAEGQEISDPQGGAT